MKDTKATKRTVAVNRTGRRVSIGLRALLIGVFFFASYPQLFGQLGDYTPDNESRLLSPKGLVETAALSRGFKSDGGQGQESFLATAAHHQIQIQQASTLYVYRKLRIRKPTLVGSFLIRSPPAKRDS